MNENLEQTKNSSRDAESKSTANVPTGEKNKDLKTAPKKPYTKPTLRKFSQIDYVTAYGID